MTRATLNCRFVGLACVVVGMLIHLNAGNVRADEITRPTTPARPEINREVKVVPEDSPMAGLVQQAFIDWLCLPSVVDGKIDGPSIRTNSLLQFVVDDYKRRIGEHPEGPAWQTLTYSIVGYNQAVHMRVARQTSVFFVKGYPSANYSIAVLDYPDSIKHALVQALLTNKDGGFYDAEWDLEWTPTGWHSLASGTPTSAMKAQIPELVK